eukprot:12122148-Prorocentrum_lima.AAC.1
MTSSLVGSEMCIRDSKWEGTSTKSNTYIDQEQEDEPSLSSVLGALMWICLLYTSDAADDM